VWLRRLKAGCGYPLSMQESLFFRNFICDFLKQKSMHAVASFEEKSGKKLTFSGTAALRNHGHF
jgi:hypothetical protein